MNILESILLPMGRGLGLGLVAVILCGSSTRADETPAKPPDVFKTLDQAWPDHPEWLDMYTDIIQGSQLTPTVGWFRRAVAQTRFDWKATQKRYDRDKDGRIARDEFPGSDADFTRLDRDRDLALTPADFDFSAHALAPSPGMTLFMRADRDGNGKVTREELDAYFQKADSGGLGYLTLSDLQDAFRPTPPNPQAAQSQSGPTKETLLRALFSQELGSLQPGPVLGEIAPDFTLKTTDGKKEVTLSKTVGPKPLVLVFGNFTCGPFRSQAGNVEKLYQMYKDRATFVMIYVREAHPTDGWHSDSNDRVGISVAQPRTYAERVSIAQTCGAKLNLGFPMLVDAIDDTVGARYSGMPSRLYLIDRDGKVAYKSGRGPFGFKPAELEQSLVLSLQNPETTTDPDGSHKTSPTHPQRAASTLKP